MSRISYADDEDFPGQFGLYDANCYRSIRGKRGQVALRRLEAALLAMPEKRLIREALVDGAQVCALGALARHEGKLPTTEFGIEDANYSMEEFGETTLNLPRLVAWRVVAKNDQELAYEYRIHEGPENQPYGYTSHGGIHVRHEITPEERYEKMLEWVRENLTGETL